MTEFKRYTLAEARALPRQPELVAGVIHGGDLIVVTGDIEFAKSLASITRARLFIGNPKAATHTEAAALIRLADQARGSVRDANRPAVVIYIATRGRLFDWFEGEAACALEATSPSLAKETKNKASPFPSHRLLRITGGRVLVEGSL